MIIWEILLIALFIPIALFPLVLITAFFFGPPFVTTPKSAVKEMVALANIHPGDTILDMGSGDGRMLLEAVKKGSRAIGWEINLYLVLWTKIMAHYNGVSKLVEVHWGSFYQADFSQANVVFLYGITHEMGKIELKLKKELKAGSKVISYTFTFPTLKPTRTSGKISVYAIA